MIIYLVRHAQTEANKNGIIQGQLNTEITKEGLRIAKEMANSFSQVQVSGIFSSPIKRAYTTACLIGNVVGFNTQSITTDERLKEIDLAPWVYKKIKELDDSDLPSSYKTYKSKPSCFLPSTGENFFDVRKRVVEAYENIISSFSDKDCVVIVSHSVAIRTLLSFIDNKNINCIWKYHIPPASVTKVFFDGEKSILDKIGLKSLV